MIHKDKANKQLTLEAQHTLVLHFGTASMLPYVITKMYMCFFGDLIDIVAVLGDEGQSCYWLGDRGMKGTRLAPTTNVYVGQLQVAKKRHLPS